MKLIKNLGYFAGLFTTIAFLPQVLKVYKTKDTKSLSIETMILFLIGQFLWVSHGVIHKDMSISFFAGFSVLLYIYLIYAKLNYN